MSNYQSILVDRDERVGIVTLNRPKELNALNIELVSELADALEEYDRDDEIRCIVITGSGEKAFAAGADIKEMSDKSPIDMMLGGFETWARIKRIHTPVIAAVGGYALGGGCELAMHCDMIVASENARFGQPEILLGVIPGAGGTQRLARTLGKYRTMEMVLTGAQVSAQEMAAHGLVNRVVPKGEHLNEAIKLALEVAEAVRRADIDPGAVEDVILGCANQAGEDNRNVARMALLLANLPVHVAGQTVNRLCGSGLQAINSAAQTIQTGLGDIVVAGGVESMTRSPFVLSKADSAFSRNMNLYDTTLGWRFVNPRLSAMHHPYSMGETAENVAARYEISRADQDAFALRSHQRAVAAQQSGWFAPEIIPVTIPQK